MQNALGLYALQLGTYLLPLATIVVLAHRLGPDNWGALAFMQAFASYVTLLVSYGYNYSGTREVARHREDRDYLRDLLSGVVGGKVVLTLLALIVLVPVGMLVPAVHRYADLFWPGVLWAMSLAFSPSWFFQGLERMWFIARWDTLARLFALAGILLLVRSPQDTWRVLVIQGGFVFGAVLIEMAAAFRAVGLRLPTPRLIIQTLRMGWAMFLFNGALSFYTISNGFILGLFGPAAVVGYYVGAEKIAKAAATLLNPINQAVYPRTSHLVVGSRAVAAQLVRKSLLLMTTAGCAMGVVLFILAPVLVRVGLGPGFEGAVVVLRILALLPPLVAISNVLGIQWMLALGLDRFAAIVIACAGLCNVILALVLVPRYLHVGMAIAVVTSETLVTVGIYAILRVKRLDPLVIAPPEMAA